MQPKMRRNFLIYFIISACLFLLLSFLVHLDTFRRLDYEAMVFLQNTISRDFDVLLSYFTPLGSAEITFFILVIIFLLVLWRRKHFFYGLAMYFLIFVIEITGKILIFHPDPPPFFNRYALGITMPSSFMIFTNFSYPSGHTARTFFLAIVIACLLLSQKNKWSKKLIPITLLLLYVFLTFISRIYLGEHWISDVIGGALLGTLTATLAFIFW